MTEAYSIHPASNEQRLAAYRNVHEVWGGGLPLDEFVERRSLSVRHNRAQWWVLTVGGEVVSSLGSYPLEFCWRGRVYPGFGIGSVHTLPAHRRKGYAESLCREVLRSLAVQGDHFALLFSDVGPAYYQRLGFRICPALGFRCDSLPDLDGEGDGVELEPLAAGERLEELSDWYQRCCLARELFLWRSGEYWRYSLLNSPADLFFRVRGPDGIAGGYVRVAERTGEMEIVELMLVECESELEQSVYRAAGLLARSRGYEAIAGWLPSGSAPPAGSVVATREQNSHALRAIGCSIGR